MRNLKGLIAAVGLAAFTAACGFADRDGIANMEPQGDAFARGLHAGYIVVADAERKEHDWADGDHFLAKAKAVASGATVYPDEVESREIPADKVDELRAARERFFNAANLGGLLRFPSDMARAQVSYDCWLQEQEENFQPDHIKDCKDGFIAAIEAVEAGLKPKPKPKPAAAPEPVRVDGIYIVYFDLDSSKLNADANAVLAQVAGDYAKANPAKIVIAGHTDTSGSQGYNAKLSAARTAAVTSALGGLGVPALAMKAESFGENQPLVVGDGKAEPRNRRVEIIFE